jgi:hypothetical protein
MRAFALIVAAASILAVGSASATPSRDTLIRPGIGIGKVRLGMTVAQVRRALGRETLVQRRQRFAFGSQYFELDWDYAQWTVGLLGRPGRMRVVSVATQKRTERTARRVGVSSTIRQILREFPRASCTSYLDPRLGPGGATLITVGPQTHLQIDWEPVANPPPGRVIVVSVVSREAPRLRSPTRCSFDWRSR